MYMVGAKSRIISCEGPIAIVGLSTEGVLDLLIKASHEYSYVDKNENPGRILGSFAEKFQNNLWRRSL